MTWFRRFFVTTTVPGPENWEASGNVEGAENEKVTGKLVRKICKDLKAGKNLFWKF